ncbi:MAG: hypothetical protein QOH79_3394 [Acidimicrobiaceae bacterium]
MTFAKLPIGRVPRFNGVATLVAIGSIASVPLLTACFPRWASRLVLPLLAVTSVGIYLTVPDTERIIVVMVVVGIAAAVCLRAAVVPSPQVVAAIAFVMTTTAILDSGGRAVAIVRAAGCFGVLLAAPIARSLDGLRTGAPVERRPALTTLAVVHCVVVAWVSRGLVHQRSLAVVIPGVGGALVVATLLLLATARPVASRP